jgi:hypothetical protein
LIWSLKINRPQRRRASRPGIGEDDVEGSTLGLHRPIEPVEVGHVRDGTLHRAGIGPEVGHSGVERLLPAAEDEDEGALLDEALCRGTADAGSAAGPSAGEFQAPHPEAALLKQCNWCSPIDPT